MTARPAAKTKPDAESGLEEWLLKKRRVYE